MARTVSTTDLIDRALVRADMVDDDFMTRAKALAFVDESWCELHDLLVEAAPPDYYSEDWTIIVTPGTSAYAVPSNFRSLLQVYAVESGDAHRPLDPIGDLDRPRFKAPSATATVLVRYVPAASELTDDADPVTGLIDGVAGWDSLVVAWAARRMLVTDKRPVGELDTEIAHLEARVRSQAPKRHRGMPKFAQDVESIGRWPYSLGSSVDAYQLRAGYLDLYAISPSYP